jgi:hypothetical protein
MSVVVLVALLLQAALGLWLLLAWRRRAPVSATAYVHAGVVVLALALWAASMAQDSAPLAWSSLLVLLVGNFLGDLLLIAHRRGVTGAEGGFFADYGAAVGAVLRGRHPARATIHAAGAGVVTVLTLVGCIVAS